MTIQYYTKLNVEYGGTIIDNVTHFTFDKITGYYIIYRKELEKIEIPSHLLLNFIVAEL